MRNAKTIKMAALLLAIFTGGELLGYDIITHMYIGSWTFNVWEEFDPDFYQALSSPSPWGQRSGSFTI